MSKQKLLHVLRNPAGWDEETVRTARLFAADIIENMISDTFFFELKGNQWEKKEPPIPPDQQS